MHWRRWSQKPHNPCEHQVSPSIKVKMGDSWCSYSLRYIRPKSAYKLRTHPSILASSYVFTDRNFPLRPANLPRNLCSCLDECAAQHSVIVNDYAALRIEALYDLTYKLYLVVGHCSRPWPCISITVQSHHYLFALRAEIAPIAANILARADGFAECTLIWGGLNPLSTTSASIHSSTSYPVPRVSSPRS